MTEKEYERAMAYISDMVSQHNMAGLAASVAESLVKLVAAQEKLVELAMIDLQEQVDAQVDGRAHEKAEEIVKDKQKRGFIGKR